MKARAPSLTAAAALALFGFAACSSDSRAEPAPTAIPIPTTTASTAPTTAPATGSTVAAPTVPPTGGTAASSAPATTTPVATPRLDDVNVQLVPLVRLEQPTAMALRAGDPALYVAERPGRVRAIRDGQLAPEPVLDITALTRAQGERGFLGLAFSPDGGHLYVSYTDREGDSHVDEYAVGADGTVDPATQRQVLFQEQPYANHNGGGILFGPDGLLFIGLGDGGSAGDPERRAQRLDTWLGKLLRIDPRPDGGQPYRVPADNPFVGQAGAKPEIWSYGLRNPWRFSFDATTNDLWIGDVGQNQIEEIDLAPAASGGGKGLNFGWSAFEGTSRFNDDQPAEGTVGPVHEYAHNAELGGCSVTGGYVYRGSAIPALAGAYVFADYCARGVRALDPAAPAEATLIEPERGSIVSFGEGPDRELYVLTLDGQIWQLVPA